MSGGPVLVLTHGFADSAETWAAQVDDLGADFTVVTWDLRGHGRAPRPDDPAAYSRELALADLDEVIAGAATTGGEVVLVGHSLGGYLSMCRAIRRPEGIRALVLVATGPGFRDPVKRERWNAGLGAVAEERGLPAAVAGVAHQPDAWLMDHLGEITLPTLLIVGSGDRTYLDGMGYLAGKIRGARLVVVEGGRHMVHRKHAAEVDAAIRDFLA